MATFARKLTPDQEIELMELVVTRSVSYREAARIWNARQVDESTQLSGEGVRGIVKRQLDAYAVKMEGAVASLRAQQDQQIDLLIRTALAIALGSRCSVCNGDKVIPTDRLDPTGAKEVCPKCDGSGRNENESTRLQAINTVKGLLERRAKLYGIDAEPMKVAEAGAVPQLIVNVHELSGAALMDELEGLFSPPALPAGPGAADTEGETSAPQALDQLEAGLGADPGPPPDSR